MINYDKEAAAIYDENDAAGLWDDPNRSLRQALQLIYTEIAKATYGERKNLMDDHLPTRKMGEVGLAGALIRTLEVGGRYEWEFNERCGSTRQSKIKDMSISDKHLLINAALIELLSRADELRRYVVVHREFINIAYSRLILAIEATAKSQGYDLAGAMAEKRAYNLNRADHKRENRAKKFGKAF